MKKLKKILLINWLYFSKEIIEVGDINFLTGKNGAGKSTVIDALQIVLLGETNARNFNQAANEKSQRTLDGYLRADMDENNPYSRRGKDFSSYIACEFQDDVVGSSFVTGVVFDCRSDGSRQERFFICVGTLPENGFVENGEAMEIPALRRFLKQNYVKAEIYDTQKEYRRNMLSRWNVHNEQVLRMMKKAVSFRPIVDIQKFITENICDIPEKPDIEAMQQNIRDYKRHEMLAQRQEEKLTALQEIGRLYAAFHDEGEHPHIHMMAWSAKTGQAYLSKEGIRQIKSKLTNDIFCNEMLHLYEQKSESRDELVRQARRAMLELVRAMQDGVCDHPDAEQLMLELAVQLGAVKGKKSYGYLPKRLKNLVDDIVDEMERLPAVSKCYDQWLMLQGKVDSYYHDKPQERIPLSQQKEFRQIKNAVIQEAERLHSGEITFEEKGLNQQDEPEEFQNASYDNWTLRDVIRDESLTMEERGEAVSEMEKLAESGDMYAQYLIGKLWRDGPLLIPDSVEARYWFERAAEQGHLVAQYSLAKLYLSDDLEVRDTRTGMNWLYTAAVNGSHYAMHRLAKECLKGEHIQKDTARAVEWFTRSAERGNPYAQYMLGKLYLAGKEVPRDEEKAAYWLTQSAEQGNQYAQYLLNHLEENRLPSAMLAVTRLLHHMSRIFRDNSVPKSRPGGIQIDRKRLKKLQEKRMALGHKLDDHEEQWPDLTM